MPGWARFTLADCLAGEFHGKLIFERADTNLKKNCSDLLPRTILGLNTFTLCLRGVLNLSHIQSVKSEGMRYARVRIRGLEMLVFGKLWART